MTSKAENWRRGGYSDGREPYRASLPSPATQQKEAAIAKRLKEFEMALDEAVASDTLYLQMVRENRTRLARDTRDWVQEYSLDKGKISNLAQRLLRGNHEHLYADLSPQDRATVEETIDTMRDMSVEDIIKSIES